MIHTTCILFKIPFLSVTYLLTDELLNGAFVSISTWDLQNFSQQHNFASAATVLVPTANVTSISNFLKCYCKEYFDFITKINLESNSVAPKSPLSATRLIIALYHRVVFSKWTILPTQWNPALPGKEHGNIGVAHWLYVYLSYRPNNLFCTELNCKSEGSKVETTSPVGSRNRSEMNCCRLLLLNCWFCCVENLVHGSFTSMWCNNTRWITPLVFVEVVHTSRTKIWMKKQRNCNRIVWGTAKWWTVHLWMKRYSYTGNRC